jgi:hypothetical protein
LNVATRRAGPHPGHHYAVNLKTHPKEGVDINTAHHEVAAVLSVLHRDTCLLMNAVKVLGIDKRDFALVDVRPISGSHVIAVAAQPAMLYGINTVDQLHGEGAFCRDEYGFYESWHGKDFL